jgi:hypothetical protein
MVANSQCNSQIQVTPRYASLRGVATPRSDAQYQIAKVISIVLEISAKRQSICCRL